MEQILPSSSGLGSLKTEDISPSSWGDSWRLLGERFGGGDKFLTIVQAEESPSQFVPHSLLIAV